MLIIFHYSFLGPIIGGYLNKEEYIQPIVTHFPFLRTYPYLFPLLIVAFLFLIAIIIVIFCCKETLPKEDRLKSHAKDLARLGSKSHDLETSLLDNQQIKKPTVVSLLMERDAFLMITAYSNQHIVIFITSFHQFSFYLIRYCVFCCSY